MFYLRHETADLTQAPDHPTKQLVGQRLQETPLGVWFVVRVEASGLQALAA